MKECSRLSLTDDKDALLVFPACRWIDSGILKTSIDYSIELCRFPVLSFILCEPLDQTLVSKFPDCVCIIQESTLSRLIDRAADMSAYSFSVKHSCF